MIEILTLQSLLNYIPSTVCSECDHTALKMAAIEQAYSYSGVKSRFISSCQNQSSYVLNDDLKLSKTDGHEIWKLTKTIYKSFRYFNVALCYTYVVMSKGVLKHLFI